MSNLAGMNLALSRLNSDPFYIETIDGPKTVEELLEYYNRCQKEKQKEENKKQEIAKRLEKISTIVKGEQNSEQPKNGKTSENGSKKTKKKTQ